MLKGLWGHLWLEIAKPCLIMKIDLSQLLDRRIWAVDPKLWASLPLCSNGLLEENNKGLL